MSDPSNLTDSVIDDVNKSTEAYLFKNDKLYIFLYLILIIVSIGIIILWIPIFQLLIIPLFIGIIGYSHVKAKIKREFTQQFGASVGSTYSQSADMSSVEGKLFKVGHSQSI